MTYPSAKAPKAYQQPMFRQIVLFEPALLKRIDRLVEAKKQAEPGAYITRSSTIRLALNRALPALEAELGVTK